MRENPAMYFMSYLTPKPLIIDGFAQQNMTDLLNERGLTEI